LRTSITGEHLYEINHILGSAGPFVVSVGAPILERVDYVEVHPVETLGDDLVEVGVG
jgi:hypothetical protein